MEQVKSFIQSKTSAIVSMLSGFQLKQEPDPWKLSFEWNTKSAGLPAPGGLLKDIWILIMTHYIDSCEDLTRFASSHPFFYSVVAQSVELQEKASGTKFSQVLSTKHFYMTTRSCRLRSSAEVGSMHAREKTVNTAIVECQRPASISRPVQVDFKLHSDFKTSSYVSYFNFSIISGHLAKEESKLLFHYFVDGDLWDCQYDFTRRRAALWQYGDVISFQIGKIHLPNRSFVACTPFRRKLSRFARSSPHASTKGAAVVLTPEEIEEGWTVYIALYKNHKMVYEPIVLMDEVPGHLALWVACKYAELKDHVEIVRQNPLPPLVVTQMDGKLKFVQSQEK